MMGSVATWAAFVLAFVVHLIFVVYLFRGVVSGLAEARRNIERLERELINHRDLPPIVRRLIKDVDELERKMERLRQ